MYVSKIDPVSFLKKKKDKRAKRKVKKKIVIFVNSQCYLW